MEMKKGQMECPSCALPVDKGLEECPYCGYEFPRTSGWIKWTALLLILVSILYLVF